MAGSSAKKPKLRQRIVHCFPYPLSKKRRSGTAEWMLQGVVYFLYCEAASAVKIGFTTQNVRLRMGAIQCGNPYPVVLLALLNGTTATEEELHLKFQDLWMRGEWYRYEGALADYIDGLDVG